MPEKILFKYIDEPGQDTIEVYMKNGGYSALPKVLKEYTPDQVTDIVKESGLRGRGGAGFPAGVKWSFVPKDSPKPKYLLINADESEPGTFKDRQLLERDPHQLIEGSIIAAYAVQAHTGFIYIRGEFGYGAKQLLRALSEAEENNFLGKDILGSGYDLEIHLHRGGGAYICGEETALMESIEGKRGLSRVRPPYPAIMGLYGCPTVINNVETLSNIPHIINKGAEWFASIGTPKSTGTKIFSLSGQVKRPGNYELPMGISLRELIYEYGGGIFEDRELKAVIPGGSSTPILTPDKLDVKLDFECVVEAGSMLGSAGVIVMDETTCMVNVAWRLTRFYQHESCGKCTPCREGTYWMLKILERIENGKGESGDVELLLDICNYIEGYTVCPLGDAAVPVVRSTIEHFQEEYDYHIRNKACMVKGKPVFK